MDSFEVSVDGELFRISERRESSTAITYEFTWLNGPANGTYGFAIGAVAVHSEEPEPCRASELSREHLIAQVQGFVDSFYDDGGIGQQDFPDHVPARRR